MYLGIDLGTSNSAIVGNENGALRHFKTPDGTDVLPSAIMLDRRGSMLVGKRAYDQAAYSPEHVAQGFKRMMGTSSVITFGGQKLMNPEEASAEIIKALIAQAKMNAGEFDVDGAVITVPAAFNQMQSEATMRAAALAGLEKVALLQEPIAAAMASIAQSKNKNGQFLVYDLGGGTFDAAIVQTISATATVIAHDGINMLGGRDFDRSIINAVVRPWLLSNFDLPDDFQKDPAFQRLVRIAQYRAELSKIALSTQLTDRIFADESQIGAKDRSGTDIYLDVEISRSQLGDLVADEVNRSIELCRKLILSSGYKSEDIDRVVLIGGPSRMPIVRDRISSELGIRADLDADPMTAVAVGAAIFSESREWSIDGAMPKKARQTKVAPGSIEIRYDFPARTGDSQFRIRVQVVDPSQSRGRRIQIDSDEGWTSGQLDLERISDIKDVPLARKGENKFKITVFDVSGSARTESSSEIIVFRAGATAAGMPLTHNLAVKVVSSISGSEKNTLHTLAKKGTILPKRGVESFRASRDFRNGDGGCLEFEVYQQVDDVTDPMLNLPVGSFRIQSSELDQGDIIRRGDPIVAHWSIDENGLLDCNLEFPEIRQTYNTGKMYVSAEGHKNYDGDEGFKLASHALVSARSDVDALERALGLQTNANTQRFRANLARQSQSLKLSTDADTRRSVSEASLLIRQEVSRIRNRPENIGSSLRSDLEQFVGEFVTSLSQLMEPKVMNQVQRLASLAREALNKETQLAIDDARRSYEEIRGLVLGELAKHPEFWEARFETLAEEVHLAIDEDLHGSLVREGEAAIRKQDVDTLRSVTFRLSENQVRVGQPSGGDNLSGLTGD
jgi:molecular chaperone DnaK